MTVSIIVPNYNHAPYLRRRIDSILAQTMGDFELVILDDASTDDSRTVIAAYVADPRVRIELNTANTGNPFLQWQKGLDLTTHDMVWIAESDDFAEPDFLETMVAALDRHPAAALAVCESDAVGPDDAFLRALQTPWPAGGAEREIDGRAYGRDHMYPWNSIPNVSAVLFRRRAFAVDGVPAVEMRLCGDWMSYCRMLMAHSIVRVPRLLNHFREHGSSVRRRSRAAAFLREAMAVQAYLREQLGLSGDASRSEIRRFFAQALLAPDRRLPSGKVPLAKAPSVIADAARFGPAMLGAVGTILLREGIAALGNSLLGRKR